MKDKYQIGVTDGLEDGRLYKTEKITSERIRRIQKYMELDADLYWHGYEEGLKRSLLNDC